jgi:hypothetical protein
MRVPAGAGGSAGTDSPFEMAVAIQQQMSHVDYNRD